MTCSSETRKRLSSSLRKPTRRLGSAVGLVADRRLNSRESYDEIARIRETIYRVKSPPEDMPIPLVLVGSELSTTPVLWIS